MLPKLPKILLLWGGGREPNLEPKSPKEPQNSDFCFCFDIDDTLIHTNLANFLSYQRAICEVKSVEIRPTILQNRCDKNLLANFSLNEGESNRIKSLKDKYFHDFLCATKINSFLFALMQILRQKHSVFLLTNAHKKRIESLLDYHNLRDLPMIFYNKSGNKYKNCIAHFHLNANAMIAFEDSDSDIKCAIDAGISNIIKI